MRGRYRLLVKLSVLARAGLVVMSSVALGFGTIFAAKANPDDHWSTSPRIVHVVEVPSADSEDSAGQLGSQPALDLPVVEGCSLSNSVSGRVEALTLAC